MSSDLPLLRFRHPFLHHVVPAECIELQGRHVQLLAADAAAYIPARVPPADVLPPQGLSGTVHPVGSTSLHGECVCERELVVAGDAGVSSAEERHVLRRGRSLISQFRALMLFLVY